MFLSFTGGVRAAGAFFFGSNFNAMFTSANVRVVPLPGTLALMAPGLLLTGLIARRRLR